jgi:hypothetical protein
MAAVRADSKKRVVIPGAVPGDVFDVQPQGDERYALVRLHRPDPAPRKSFEECLEAMSQAPLRMTLSWEELRQITREP